MRNHLIIFFSILSLSLSSVNSLGAAPVKNSGYFVLRVYHFSAAAQQASIDSFLRLQLLPYLHRSKLNHIGVFNAIANDTSADKKIYVFIPFNNLQQWETVHSGAIENGMTGDGGYANAAYNNPAYSRFETVLLKAFPLMPPIVPSKLSSPKSDRVYELRSYEGPSEKFFRNKVKMFNEGGEIPLFNRLGFNGVFYGEVMFGSKMPNLMYMTSFENMKSREEHWEAFRNDPEWKTLSGKQEYQHNVSHIDITFLRPTEYSEL